MIKSMTGFGRGECTKNDKTFFVEIKSVNHRYCDINIRMYKKFNFLESRIKQLISKTVTRGKVDVFITYEDNTETSNSVKVNMGLIEDYLKNFNEISDRFNIANTADISLISKLPDVMKLEEQDIDEELIWSILEEAIKGSLTNLIGMRKTEGAQLREDLLIKLINIEKIVDNIEVRSPLVVEEYKKKLYDKVDQIRDKVEVDENRLATEILLFSDRCSIDEELVRLASHVNQMRDTLDSDLSVGRKFDFLAQEMNREANTIASKTNDLMITNLAIDLKTEIEKIREQIQNIE